MRKNYAVIFLFTAIVPLLLLESCYVEKRRYMDGYYVEWNHSKPDKKAHKGKTRVKFLVESETVETVQVLSEEVSAFVSVEDEHLAIVIGDTVPVQKHDTVSESSDEGIKHEPKFPEDKSLPVHPDAKEANTFAWIGWGTWVGFVIFASLAQNSFAFGWVLFVGASLMLIGALIFAYQARRELTTETKYRGRNISRNVIITSWLFFILHAIGALTMWLVFATGNLNLTFGD